jgi:hypothetical protein
MTPTQSVSQVRAGDSQPHTALHCRVPAMRLPGHILIDVLALLRIWHW